MKQHIGLINYPESEWGTDLVRFMLPDQCTDAQVLDELSYGRMELHSAAFPSLQDMADALCENVANTLGGTWEYVAQCGSFNITEDDDEGDDDEEIF